MKIFEGSLILIGILVVVSAIIGVAASKLGEDDNKTEEAAEEFIEEYLGIDIDLTPNSTE